MERTPGPWGMQSALPSLIISNVIWRKAEVGSVEHTALAELQRGEMIPQEGTPFLCSPCLLCVSLVWFVPKRLGWASRGCPETRTSDLKFGGSGSCGHVELKQNSEASLQTYLAPLLSGSLWVDRPNSLGLGPMCALGTGQHCILLLLQKGMWSVT